MRSKSDSGSVIILVPLGPSITTLGKFECSHLGILPSRKELWERPNSGDQCEAL